MKCCKCDRAAVYDSPEDLCFEHWTEWWGDAADMPEDKALMTQEARDLLRDNCQVCKGENGGVRGNENIVDDVVLCDYCLVAQRTAKPISSLEIT